MITLEHTNNNPLAFAGKNALFLGSVNLSGLGDFGQQGVNNQGYQTPVNTPSAQMTFQPSAPAKPAATTTPAPSNNNSAPSGPINGDASARAAGYSDFAAYQNAQAQGGGGSDPYAAIKSQISGAWDSYLGSLNDTANTYLPQQQTAQNNIADDQLKQGQDTVNTQKAQSLRDIANTTKSAFQAGNNYLGALGAGDSSAANQYSFAISQQAGKQTGDLNNFVNTQLNTLQNTHDQQVQTIANWFAQQQEAIKQQVAQGNLQKGQDLSSLSTNILNQAIAATQAVKQNTQNQYNALVSWATSNAASLPQLQQNIAAIPGVMGQIATQGPVNTAPAYGGSAPTAAATSKTDIFGNPIT